MKDKCDRCGKERYLLQFMFIDIGGESKFYCEECRGEINKVNRKGSEYTDTAWVVELK